MSSESDLSDYESDLSDYESENEIVDVGEKEDVGEEEYVGEEEEITPIVREINSEYFGWNYSPESNSYNFRGIDALIDIINYHDGNVDVFILHDSTIKYETFFAARLNRIKNLSIYAPVQVFPVFPK